MWSAPDTRAKLLQGLAEKGFGSEQMAVMQQVGRRSRPEEIGSVFASFQKYLYQDAARAQAYRAL